MYNKCVIILKKNTYLILKKHTFIKILKAYWKLEQEFYLIRNYERASKRLLKIKIECEFLEYCLIYNLIRKFLYY